MNLSKELFDDLITRRPGTIMGEVGRKNDEMFRPKLPTVGDGKKGRRASEPSTGDGGAFFPGVDAWFDTHLPMGVRRVLALVLAVVGALVGAGSSVQFGLSVGLAGALGAIAGLMVVPLIILVVKLALLALILGFISLVIYGIVTVLSTT